MKPKFRLRPFGVVAASVLLAALVAHFLGWRGKSYQSADGPHADTSIHHQTGRFTNLPNPKLALRPVTKRLTEHERSLLARFYLPPITFQKADIEMAIGRILGDYHSLAKRSHSRPITLSVDCSQASRQTPISFTTPRAPVETVLRIVAAVSGNRLLGAGPEYRLSELPASEALIDRRARSERLLGLITQAARARELPSAADFEARHRAAFKPVTLEIGPSIGANDFQIDLSFTPEIVEFVNFPPIERDPGVDLQALGFSESASVRIDGDGPIFRNLQPSDGAILGALEMLADNSAEAFSFRSQVKSFRLPSDSLPEIETRLALAESEFDSMLIGASNLDEAEPSEPAGVSGHPGGTATVSRIDTVDVGARSGTIVGIATIPLGLGYKQIVTFQEGSRSLADSQIQGITRIASGIDGERMITRIPGKDGFDTLLLTTTSRINASDDLILRD